MIELSLYITNTIIIGIHLQIANNIQNISGCVLHNLFAENNKLWDNLNFETPVAVWAYLIIHNISGEQKIIPPEQYPH